MEYIKQLYCNEQIKNNWDIIPKLPPVVFAFLFANALERFIIMFHACKLASFSISLDPVVSMPIIAL